MTGLEPAASCVTGMRSNQLSYTRNSLAVRTYLMTVFTLLVNDEIVYMLFSYPQGIQAHKIDFLNKISRVV